MKEKTGYALLQIPTQLFVFNSKMSLLSPHGTVPVGTGAVVLEHSFSLVLFPYTLLIASSKLILESTHTRKAVGYNVDSSVWQTK